MKNEEVKNETELLSEDERQLSRTLKNLSRVEAPKDFDFRLKARLANAKASDFQKRPSWAFRYALPVLSVALLFSVVAYNGGFWSSAGTPPVAANQEIVPETNSSDAPEKNLFAAQPSPAPQNFNEEKSNPSNRNSIEPSSIVLAENNPKKKEIERNSPVVKDNQSNSTVQSFSNSIVIQPPMNNNIISPNSNANAAGNFARETKVSASEILNLLGIQSVFENGVWKVKTVAANSLAERSGIKSGDLVESLNNQTISPATSFSNQFKGKTVTVSRGGKKLEIKLQNK